MLRDLIAQRPINNAPWLTVVAPSLAAGEYFKLVVAHAMTGEENGGNHHVYVDVIESDGDIIQNPISLSVWWDWAGRQPSEAHDRKLFDKPAPEPGTNIPLWPGQDVSCWIAGSQTSSDMVRGLSSWVGTTSPDGKNRPGHYSYYLVFQASYPALPPVIDARPLTLESLDARVKKLEAAHGLA